MYYRWKFPEQWWLEIRSIHMQAEASRPWPLSRIKEHGKNYISDIGCSLFYDLSPQNGFCMPHPHADIRVKYIFPCKIEMICFLLRNEQTEP